MARSVLLLSGGPDSATLAYWARANGHDDLHALYLRCGHATDEMEMRCADTVAANVGARLEIIDISQMVAGLGGQRVLIHSESSIMPFGNAIVLSMAVTYTLKLRASSILIALHADDAAESVEYRRPFIDSIESLARSAHGEITISTPFMDMTKTQVFTLGAQLSVDYSKTWSCIRPGPLHCGCCGACRARARAFEAAGAPDLTTYEQPVVALQSVATR
ncbi:MAG: 7-cyano-7-deazaguanine synthase [Egibacteraceae bacterium]